MKPQIQTALALLSGIVIGGVGFGALHAQTGTPAAYLVTEVLEIADQTAFLKAIDAAPATLPPFGGHYLARGGKIVAVNGAPPNRIAILAFDSLEKAQQWRRDPAEVAAAAEVGKVAKTRSYFVEGIAN